MTGAVKLTSGLVGLYMAICLDALICFSRQHHGSTAVRPSIGLAAFALAVMVTQMDRFNRLLVATPLKAGQFLLALSAAVLLFVLWELGKLISRRRMSTGKSTSARSSSAVPAHLAGS